MFRPRKNDPDELPERVAELFDAAVRDGTEDPVERVVLALRIRDELRLRVDEQGLRLVDELRPIRGGPRRVAERLKITDSKITESHVRRAFSRRTIEKRAED